MKHTNFDTIYVIKEIKILVISKTCMHMSVEIKISKDNSSG